MQDGSCGHDFVAFVCFLRTLSTQNSVDQLHAVQSHFPSSLSLVTKNQGFVEIATRVIN